MNHVECGISKLLCNAMKNLSINCKILVNNTYTSTNNNNNNNNNMFSLTL